MEKRLITIKMPLIAQLFVNLKGEHTKLMKQTQTVVLMFKEAVSLDERGGRR